MTLQEKFLKLFPHQTDDYLEVDEAILCENIADEFAIGFAEWLINSSLLKTEIPMRVKLKIYKKQLSL